MKRRILYIKPSSYSTVNEAIKQYLEEYKLEDTVIEVVNVPKGPKHLESSCYEALAAAEILKLVLWAEKKNYDGAIIGCFKDPILRAAREACGRLCVVGPAEASVLLAASLGYKFSIIVGRNSWIPDMEDNIYKYGMQKRLASFRSLNMGVLEFHKDEVLTARVMRREIKAALEEDRAEVIILGCTMNFGFFEELQKEFKVPVIDPMLAALKNLEMLIEVRDKMSWYSSKIGGYATPDRKEIKDWHIEEDFDMKGLW
ncbi:MAG TPA: aspartate/glutamate racemase family protein [Clostridia bacterium]|nr:aspartate/glutamate racemase family protein [Clostridia bacterium]